MSAVHVILLRAIGGATHKLLTMSALEARLKAVGMSRTRNLLATGNLVTRTEMPPEAVAALVRAELDTAGLTKTDIFIRSPAALKAVVAANPFPVEVVQRPSTVQLVCTSRPVANEAIAALAARGRQGEQIARAGTDLVIDYGGPISQSMFTPVLVERLLGVVTTARNWNTTQKIIALADVLAEGTP